MAWIDTMAAVTATVFGTFMEDITLHLFAGDSVISGIYTETVADDAGLLRTEYALDVLLSDAQLLKKGDQLTARGMRFEFIKATPNNGLEHLELRRL